jgi:anti-sigma factor RsiW
MSGFSSSRESFSCTEVRRSLPAYLNGALNIDTRIQMDVHFSECPECAEESIGVRELRRSMRSMPRITVPAGVATRLNVLASREAARRRSRATLSQVITTWGDNFRLWVNNLIGRSPSRLLEALFPHYCFSECSRPV